MEMKIPKIIVFVSSLREDRNKDKAINKNVKPKRRKE